ncbi:hypothetical protein QYM36_003202 [Artemia franciscana]|uniref:ethanolamine kinase n=1 Tax=Artemia franciscana TaxID=6661 RepID=A0AA88IJM2_ARTSF|nr:hypothetical protein QYM36_003202 [Artemia franciscana]
MNVKELHFEIGENDLIPSSLEIIRSLRPSWNVETVTVKLFTNGTTNRLLGVSEKTDTNKDDMILIRVYGVGTNLIINRQIEINNLFRLQEVGIGSKLYATFKNGLAYEYIKGEKLDTTLCCSEKIYPKIAHQLARFHAVPLESDERKPHLWKKLRLFLNLKLCKFLQEQQKEKFQKILPTNELEKEISLLEGILSRLGSPIVFCHNDLTPDNILYDTISLRLSFIDLEYAGPNYQAFDIANHFNEFAGIRTVDYRLYPNDEFQTEWLKIYLHRYKSIILNSNEVSVSTEEISTLRRHVDLFSLASHFFWALWGLIQATKSTIDFDFLEYAIIRFDEYFSKKKILLEDC